LKKTRACFAKNLKQLRKEQELSQEQFAHKANLDRSTVSKIELCKRNVSIDTVAKIAVALDVKVTKLFYENSNNE
jgi:transcriptional regulator with XRE-family HTH domain